MNLFGWLKPIVGWVDRELRVVGSTVTNTHIQFALDLIGRVDELNLFTKAGVLDKTAAREWVVHMLITKFNLPESLARYILELAFQLYKSQRSTRRAV